MFIVISLSLWSCRWTLKNTTLLAFIFSSFTCGSCLLLSWCFGKLPSQYTSPMLFYCYCLFLFCVHAPKRSNISFCATCGHCHHVLIGEHHKTQPPFFLLPTLVFSYFVHDHLSLWWFLADCCHKTPPPCCVVPHPYVSLCMHVRGAKQLSIACGHFVIVMFM
jgi:hypothetical protein